MRSICWTADFRNIWSIHYKYSSILNKFLENINFRKRKVFHIILKD